MTGVTQCVTSAGVDLPHTPDVMAEVTLQNEVGENCLFQGGWMPVEETPRGRKRFHDAFGKNDEAQSQ